MADIVLRDQAISDAKDEMFASLSFYVDQIILTNENTKNNLIASSKAVSGIDGELVSLDLEDLAEVERRKAAEKRIERFKEREFIMESKPTAAMTSIGGPVIDAQTQKRGAIDFAKIAGLVGLLLIPQVREAILAVLDGIIRSVVGGEDAIKKFKIAAGLIAGTLALFWSRAKIANIFNALYQVVNLALVTATALGLIQDTADELDNERRRLKKDREAFEKEKANAKKTGKGKIVAGAAGVAAGKAVGDVAQESSNIPTTEKEIEVELPDRGDKKKEKEKEKQPEQKKEESKSKLKKAAGAAGSTAKKLLKTVPIIGAVAGAAEVAYDTAGAIREAEETGKPVDVPEIVTDQIIQNVTFGIFNLESAREKIKELKGDPTAKSAVRAQTPSSGLAPAPTVAPTPSAPPEASKESLPSPATTTVPVIQSSAAPPEASKESLPSPAATVIQSSAAPISVQPSEEVAPLNVQVSVTAPPPKAVSEPVLVVEKKPQVSASLPKAEAVAAQTVKQAVDASGVNDVKVTKSEAEKLKAQREVEFTSKMFALEIEKGLSVMPEIKGVDSGSQILKASGERAILKEAYDVLSRLNIVNINNTKNIFAPEEEMSN